MSYTVSSILSFSISIAAILGWIRFKKIKPAYYSFIFLLTIGFVSEVWGFLLNEFHYSNAIVYNIYTLIEAVLILWQFKQWKIIKFRAKLLKFFLLILWITWIIENFYFSNIYSFGSYFIILYSFLIVLLSIQTLNVLIVQERHSLLENPIFLICSGFLLYFTYSIMVETFWMHGLNRNAAFQSNIYDILVIINLFVNLVYAVAVLWIPTKPKFILLS